MPWYWRETSGDSNAGSWLKYTQFHKPSQADAGFFHNHDIHNDYPLSSEAVVVPKAWLSEYHKNFTDCVKLAPNLRRKERCVVHYRNLKLYQSLGMVTNRIHWAETFRQEPWIAPYIEINS